MDSPHLLPLGLLLLALAAPHANIAMSTVGTAERIEDYSTEVTVYRCRDCNSCTCKSGANDFENFKKIADTQNNIFSDVIIELETNKTHTTVCFEEPNFCLEEVYGIFWRRDGGSGLSCGTLSSGENGNSDISTEKTICCEAETDTRRYNPEVKCFYTQKSRPKLKTLPVGDPAERIAGNPEFLTSTESSPGMRIGIWCAVLFVGICTLLVAMYYCWQRHGQACRRGRQAPEGENLVHV